MSRRRRGPPTCQECHAPVVFYRSPFTGLWRTFDPKPVDRRGAPTAMAYPVENERAWRPRDLIEDLMVRHQQSEARAAAEVDDMPWHVPHNCQLRAPAPTLEEDP